MSKDPNNTVLKWTFPGRLKMAWNDAVTPKNIASGFRACGIHAFNPTAIPEEAYEPSTPFERPEQETVVMNTRQEQTEPTEHEPVMDQDNQGEIPALQVDQNNIMWSDAEGPVNDSSTMKEIDLNQVNCVNLSFDMLTGEQIGNEILAGELELLADTCISVSESTPLAYSSTLNADWNNDVENLFKPPKANRPVKPGPRKSLTSHRILTSDGIISQKKEAKEKKERLKQQKHARQERNKKLLKLLQDVGNDVL